MSEKLNVKVDTIIRTCVLAVALINQILLAFGKSPIPVSDEQLQSVITLSFTICASIWAWWKNNSFTKEALKADQYLKIQKTHEFEEDE